MPHNRSKIFIMAVILVISLVAGQIMGRNQTECSDLLRDLAQPKAKETPWQIQASRLEYKEKQGLYVAEGDVVIKKGGQVLKAQRAVYDRRSGIAKVWGNVRFESQGDVLSGERGVFYLKEQTGRIEKGHIFLRENNLHVTGRSMERLSENTYRVKDCRITTCDGPRPAWSITASEVKVTVEGYGTAKHAAFRVKDFPVFYLPYFIFPAKTKRQTGLLPPRFGYSGRNGADLEIPFFWAISDQTDATFYQRYMSKRGYMQGLEFRYVMEDRSRGTVLLDGIRDRKDKDLNDPDDVELSPFDRTNTGRYWVRGRADQNLPWGIQARADLDYVSDQDYLREYTGGLFGYEARPDLEEKWGRPLEERLSPLRTSTLLVGRLWEDTSLQASSSYHERPEDPSPDDTPQPLFGLHFAKLTEGLGRFPLYMSMETDYEHVWRDYGEKGHEVRITPEFRLPLRLGHYLEMEPSLCFRYDGRWVEEDRDKTDDGWQRDYQADMRLSSRLERVFDVSTGHITKLRHTIWPTLTYTFHALQEGGKGEAWFDPAADKGKVNRLTLSVENHLDARRETKQGGVTYQRWASLTLSQSYNIDEVRRASEPGVKRRPFDPLSISFTLKPLKPLDIYWTAQWDHYAHDFTSNDLSAELWMERGGGRRDHYKMEYQTAKGQYRNLNLSVDVGLVYGFSVGGSLQKDFYADQDISTSGWVNYQSQCWGVKLVAERENDDTRFMVFFELKGLGEIRTW
ncbi:MAG: hypothetical protein DRG63_07605 [Deltaproteobacteria bacterium]|nr:MAG: hypothetical protein DRG63_07605 [Deltaproteobacteria bacterium]